MSQTSPRPPFRISVRPRIRILLGEEVALGPGKAALLEAIAATGTLARAAETLGMSYMRAWRLVQTMNRCFRGPLVATARGGKQRGQASLTPSGRAVLELYRRMELSSLAAVEPTWRELSRYLGRRPEA
jgi:molybdate transport system regulatory protein